MARKKQKRSAKDLWKKACKWVKRYLRDERGAKNVVASRAWTNLANKVITECRNPTAFSLSYCLTTSYNSRRKVALENLKLKKQISKQRAFIDNKLPEEILSYREWRRKRQPNCPYMDYPLTVKNHASFEALQAWAEQHQKMQFRVKRMHGAIDQSLDPNTVYYRSIRQERLDKVKDKIREQEKEEEEKRIAKANAHVRKSTDGKYLLQDLISGEERCIEKVKKVKKLRAQLGDLKAPTPKPLKSVSYKKIKMRKMRRDKYVMSLSKKVESETFQYTKRTPRILDYDINRMPVGAIILEADCAIGLPDSIFTDEPRK